MQYTGTPITRRSMLGLFTATAASTIVGFSDTHSAAAQTGAVTSSRPRFHLTPATAWINDPQRPVWLNHKWNLWVLWNGNYGESGGTAWRHYTSIDLIIWTDEGISIPKYTNAYGDVWTGSTVIDVKNVAGYGAGALIALMTMPCDDASGQNQSTALWYSMDRGMSFTFGEVVQPNYPGNNSIFRDPSVFWHGPTKRWIMSLAESGKLSIYTSQDLKQWTYASGLLRDNLGIMECPNLFPLHLYSGPGCTKAGSKWVLLCGANGYLTGRTTGTYYWVGTFDGVTFTPDTADGQWLDQGADFYATTVFLDCNTGDPLASAYAIAWMNNWDYATEIPTVGYAGQLSVTRSLRLQMVNGAPMLLSAPLPGLNRIFTSRVSGTDQVISDATGYTWPAWPGSPASRIDFTLGPASGVWPGAVWFSVRGGDGYFTQVGFEISSNNVFLKRDTGGPEPTTDSTWNANRNAAFVFTAPVSVTVLVDVGSIEVFLNDGVVAISGLLTAPADATGLNLTVSGGSASISELTIQSVA